MRPDARRGRQAWCRRFSRRPVIGPARSARSGTELDVPRQLSRGAVRPVRGDVHLHRERARHDSRPAARPHGGHSATGLHGAREAADRATLSGRASTCRRGTHGRAVRDQRRSAAGHHQRLHSRSGRAQPEREIGNVCRHTAMRLPKTAPNACTSVSTNWPPSWPAPVRGGSGDGERYSGVATGPRGRRWVATSLSSRRRAPGAGALYPDGTTRRRDERERTGGAVTRQGALAAIRHCARNDREVGHPRSRPPALRRRTAPARVSRCSWRSRRCWPAGRYAAISR